MSLKNRNNAYIENSSKQADFKSSRLYAWLVFSIQIQIRQESSLRATLIPSTLVRAHQELIFNS